MLKSLSTGALVLGILACAGAAAKELPKGRAVSASYTATASASAVADAAAASSVFTLESGTRVNATIQDEPAFRRSRPGAVFRATVTSEVGDSHGNIVIPAGGTVLLSIRRLEPGSDQVGAEGQLSLLVTSVSVGGVSYSLYGTLDPVVPGQKRSGPTKETTSRIADGTMIIITLPHATLFGR